MSIVTLKVTKGTFAWAVAMLAKGYTLRRKYLHMDNMYWQVQQSPEGLHQRHQNKSDVTYWRPWLVTQLDFEAKDWELV